MKELIVNLLNTELQGNLPKENIEKLIEIPPSEEMGDFAFPCFSLAKVYRKSPAAIAEELCTKFCGSEGIEKVKAVSGYINFFIDKKALTLRVLKDTASENFGEGCCNQTFVVEFASPNTNKPLHLGHLRNMSIGESVSRLLAFCGNNVVRTSINNDRGVHICKSMLAYEAFGEGKTPEEAGKKSDHYVGDFYVLFSKKAAEDESWNQKAQEMLRKWEDSDEHTMELWKKMNKWAFDGFESTYGLFGIKFDKQYYESQIFRFGKEIITDGLNRGIFHKRADGAVVVDLESEKLGEKVLLRPDGTSVYIVQDLYLAVLKQKEFHYDQSIYVVGNEQEFHFAVLKAIFKKLGFDISEKIKHLSYGMVELPEGKMKSREGTVVDADDLIRETQVLAVTELKERYTLSDEEMEDRSKKIALSAIKYQLLKTDITKNMVFDPKKAISFEGDTGPYLLYSYARASSILRKAGHYGSPEIKSLNQYEIRLAKKVGFLPETVKYAYDKLSPSVIAVYAFELAQTFNEFYHACQVIGSEEQDLRLQLVNSFRSVLKKCLGILGIDEIEEM